MSDCDGQCVNDVPKLQAEIEQLKNTIAMLEADCEDGTCRACVKCHDARERERNEARAKIVAMHKIAWPQGGDLNGDPESDLLLMVGTFKCTIRDLEAERDKAVSAAVVQNKACAEEMFARQRMQANWDTMVASVKQHYEAQLRAEAENRKLKLAIALKTLIRK